MHHPKNEKVDVHEKVTQDQFQLCVNAYVQSQFC
jgi:hypothetical protein